MITEKRTKEKQDGTKIKYSVEIPESIQEAIDTMAPSEILGAIQYFLRTRAGKLAEVGVPLTKELKKLLRTDPELRALAMKKLKGE